MAPQMATGVPPPAAPSRKAPKAKPIRMAWMRASPDRPGHGAADDVELSGLDRDVVQQHGVEDGPADRQQSERGPIDERHQGHARRHAVDDDGDEDGGERGGGPGLGRQPAPRHQQPEQHHDRQRREQGGPHRGPGDGVFQRVEVLLIGPKHEATLGGASQSGRTVRYAMKAR